jgi:hypothetical protein
MGNMKSWKVVLFCVAAAVCNAALGQLVNKILMLPLYLDTLFTVAITFSFGLIPGIVTGVALYPLHTVLPILLRGAPPVREFATNLYILCTRAEIILVWRFRSKVRQYDSFTHKCAILLQLVVLDCLLVSAVGGFVDFALVSVLSPPIEIQPEDLFKLSLLRNNIGYLVAAILSRVPINIVDRLIAVFGGYGVSRMMEQS